MTETPETNGFETAQDLPADGQLAEGVGRYWRDHDEELLRYIRFGLEDAAALRKQMEDRQAARATELPRDEDEAS